MKLGVMRWGREGGRARSCGVKKALRAKEFGLPPEGSGELLEGS